MPFVARLQGIVELQEKIESDRLTVLGGGAAGT